jgi:hypothetical protein
MVGTAAHAQQPRAGKLVRVAEGGKLHRRGGRPTSHMSCKQTLGQQEQQHMPSKQEQENLKKQRWEENSTGRGRRPTSQ